MTCYLVVASPSGCWTRLFRQADKKTLGRPLRTNHVVGVVIGHWNVMTTVPSGHYGVDEMRLIQAAVRRGKGRNFFLLLYFGVSKFVLHDVIDFNNEYPDQLFEKLLPLQGEDGDNGEVSSFTDWFKHWCDTYNSGRQLPIAVAKLGHHAATLAVTEHDIWHGTVLGWGLPRNWLIGDSPTPKQTRRIMRETQPFDVDTFEAAQLDLPSAIQPHMHSTPVHIILEWLDATRDLKAIRMKDKSCQKWNKIISRAREVENTPLEETVGYNVLRFARIRVDCMAMMLWRERFKHLDAEEFNVHLHSDGSPQWAGVELFASSFDLLTVCQESPSGYCVERRLFPMINIGMSMFTALGKCFALLWQIFLISGPRFEDVQKFLVRVRSLTVDFGTERLLADHPDVLQRFFKTLGGYIPARAITFNHLLPRCLLSPGWRHTADRIIRRVRGALPFFPRFLRRVKAVNAFIRHYRSDLAKLLKESGAVGVADLVSDASLPYFAEWRWGTLHGVLRSLDTCIRSLIATLDITAFIRRARATHMVNDVRDAFTVPVFEFEMKFMVWFTRWLTGMQLAATWCPCHLEACKKKEFPNCNMRGRILPIIPEIRSFFLEESIAEMEQWTPSMWGGDGPFMRNLQGSVRWAHGLILEVTRFADVLPYLFSRLDKPGIRNECRRQYELRAHDQHHRVTQQFMHSGSALRRMVDRISDDGDIYDEYLKREVESIANISLDDNVNESPHAGVKKEMARCRPGKFPWTASTSRLDQNLGDLENMKSSASQLQELWNNYSSVIQVKRQRLGSPVRCTKHVFTTRLYLLLSGFCDSGGEDSGAEEDGGGDSPAFDDIDGGGGALVVRRPAKRPKRPVQDGEDGVDARKIKQQADLAMLVREWLIVALKQFEYMSVWTLNAEGALHFRVFQILSCNVNIMTVPTIESSRPQDFGLKVCVQELEIWRADQITHESLSIDVFTGPPPYYVDMLGLVGTDVQGRLNMHYWTSGLSDLDGCIELTRREVVRPTVSLADSSCPVLCLVEDRPQDEGGRSRAGEGGGGQKSGTMEEGGESGG